jgi:hypothetical protein
MKFLEILEVSLFSQGKKGNNENQTYSSCLVGFDVFEPNARKQRDENHFVIYNSH